MIGNPALLKPHEARARLRVSDTTLVRYARQGLISAKRLPGGQRRYIAETVDALLDQSTPTAP
ncbi:helix-turn-helix domain-containing protein [Parafrankia discariae]|uniref:helix-turn-helix domain-containing protein n=1 Tax=Parafrankia discariae TaxID=365528 RepID=UPI00036BB0CE|nr:helix-turn-helix domain-containing protein [Parafrankia discariae]